MDHTWMTRHQAAERAEVSLRTVARWLAEGKLTKHVDGRGGVWIDPGELKQLLEPVPTAVAS